MILVAPFLSFLPILCYHILAFFLAAFLPPIGLLLVYLPITLHMFLPLLLARMPLFLALALSVILQTLVFLPIALVLLLIASTGAALVFGLRSRGASEAAARLVIPLAAGEEVSSYPAISPDGRTIAYTAKPMTEIGRASCRERVCQYV